MRIKVTKETIIQASEKLIRQDGYEALTLAGIAKALNIKTPSLYNHISSLNDLKQNLALYAVKHLKHAVTVSAIGKSGADALKSISFAVVYFMRDHPEWHEMILSAPDPLEKAFSAASSEIIAVFFKVLEPYKFSEEKAIHIVRGLRALSQGFVSLERRRGFNLDVSLDDSISLAFDIFIKGMLAALQDE